MVSGRPGNGFLGWLGRQVGYIRKAIRTDVTRTVIHREQKVQEARLPQKPGVTLRRTVIDEVIVEKQAAERRSDEATKGTED